MINVHKETERSRVLANVLGGNAGQWAVLAAGTGGISHSQPRRNQMNFHITLRPIVCYHWGIAGDADGVSCIMVPSRKTKQNRKTNRKEPMSVSIGPPGCQLEMFSTRSAFLAGADSSCSKFSCKKRENSSFSQTRIYDKVNISTMGTPRYCNKTSAQKTRDKIRPWDTQIMRVLEKKELHRPVKLI